MSTSPAQDGSADVLYDQNDTNEAKLHSLLLEAAADVCGTEIANEVFSMPRERPKRTPSGENPPAPRTHAADVKCHAPVTLFRKLYNEAMQRERNGGEENKICKADAVETFAKEASPGEYRVYRLRPNTNANTNTNPPCTTNRNGIEGIRVLSKTTYGTVKHRVYENVSSLADAIVEATNPKKLGEIVAHALVTDGSTSDDDKETNKKTSDELLPGSTLLLGLSTKPVKPRRPVKPGGELSFVTTTRLLQARSKNLLLCAKCQTFLQGDKGLREHGMVRHRESYELALGNVTEARNAMVVVRSAGYYLGNTDTHSDDSQTAAQGDGKKPLHKALAAARDGNLPLFKDCICYSYSATGHAYETKNWDPLQPTSTDHNGSCALHWAAGSGALDVCKFLVETLGEDPNRKQIKDGRTAMHWAARNGRVEVCKWLHENHHVSINQPTFDGTTPFMWAVWGGGGGDEEEEDEGDEEGEESEGNDVGDKKRKESPSLRYATLDWLVHHANADIHTMNSFGCNASQWAAQRRYNAIPMFLYLQNTGVDIKIKNKNGHSALHKAAVVGGFETCVWLISQGNLDASHLLADGDGNTPGEMARLEGFLELAQYLTEEEKRLTIRGENSMNSRWRT